MKSFKEFLNENNLKINIFNDKHSFIIDPQYENESKLYNIKINKIESSFKKDKDYYIGVNGTNGINNRYNRFIKFLNDNPKIDIIAPSIYIDDNGEVQFNNGRHRYAVIRDLGIETIPFSISNNNIKQAKKYNYI